MATQLDRIYHGDCREVLAAIPDGQFSACITDPPYNYEFIGRDWDETEIERRLNRVQESNTLVKNIPYGSGLAGGVRNARWYRRNRENILEYREWCKQWGEQVFRTLRSGAYLLVFNSTRTVAHVQVAMEDAGFYARDILVYRRHSGIPKGLNASKKLKTAGHRDWEAWEGWHSCLRNEWEAICLLQKPLVDNYVNTIAESGVGLLRARPAGEGFLSNILDGFRREKTGNAGDHCTVKPLELIRFLARLIVPDHGSHAILDPFNGTGTTCCAARDLGHHYVGIDSSKRYCEIAEARLNRSAEPAALPEASAPNGGAPQKALF